MLRTYRAGQPLPRVFGHVYLEPFHGWPGLNGPRLDGVEVTLTSGGTVIRTRTRADGAFSLDKALPGVYKIAAELPPYVPAQPQSFLTVPKVGCGFLDVALRTTTELRGVVLDHASRPAKKVPVHLTVLSTADNEWPTSLTVRTDDEGRFGFVGVPDTDVLLSYGSYRLSSEWDPYPLTFYREAASRSDATALRLRVGEKREGMVLRLPPSPRLLSVKVKVVRLDGSVVGGAMVNAMLDGVFTEFVSTASEGGGELPCFEGLEYQVVAGIPAGPSFASGVLRNKPVPIVCGQDRGPLVLTLDHVERF